MYASFPAYTVTGVRPAGVTAAAVSANVLEFMVVRWYSRMVFLRGHIEDRRCDHVHVAVKIQLWQIARACKSCVVCLHLHRAHRAAFMQQ
jgi:hypothetical protein